MCATQYLKIEALRSAREAPVDGKGAGAPVKKTSSAGLLRRLLKILFFRRRDRSEGNFPIETLPWM